MAVAELLKKRGHEVVYCFPVQFKNLLPEYAKFHPLSAEFLELINSKEGSTVMGKADIFKKAKALFTLYKKGKRVSKIIANEHIEALKIENPDVIIQHPKCAVPFLWNLKFKTRIITYSPVPFVLYPVKDHPHIGWPYLNNPVYIKLSYKVSTYAWVKQIYDVQSKLKMPFKYSKSEISASLFKNKIIYAVSPQLFERPENWPKHVEVGGHHEPDKSNDFKPAKSLLQFIETHDKILFLTFGSMVNYAPQKTSQCFYEVIDTLGMPCIVNTSSGGLVQLSEYARRNNFYFVQDIPYDWLFKHVHAVIHHGGSGTTHMGLKHGLPTLIIPHIIDQFMWNRLIYQKQLGPKGISINKINSQKLKPLIESLFNKNHYSKNTKIIASKMAQEKKDKPLVECIEN